MRPENGALPGMDDLREIIEKNYGVSVEHAKKLNAGFDRNTTVYKVFSKTEETFFLKIRTGHFSEIHAAIPFWLSTERGFSHIINPVKTVDHKLFADVSSRCFMLYPFVDGRSGWDAPPAGECLYALGQFLRRLHTVTLPGQYSGGIVHETYADTYRKKVKKFLENLEQGSPDGAAPADFFTVVRQNRETMREMISYLEGITGEIKNASPPLCLCHGDIHAGNLLLTPDDFYVVDWDTAMLAPKEKDVMFFGGGIGNRWNREEETEWFYRGYGKKVETNRTLLKYYRYERIIEDVYEFARLITDRAAAEAEKTTALELFRGQFEPDNAVDMALRT